MQTLCTDVRRFLEPIKCGWSFRYTDGFDLPLVTSITTPLCFNRARGLGESRVSQDLPPATVQHRNGKRVMGAEAEPLGPTPPHGTDIWPSI